MRRMIRRLRWVRPCVPALVLVLTACTAVGRESAGPTAYDFGPPPAFARSNPAIAGALLIPPVTAPAWLDDSNIVYRLLYEDGARPQSYAMSRWAGEPASLLTDRLRSRFAAATDAVVTPGYSIQTDYALRIELEDFTQRFDAPGQSRASLRARATLLDTHERRLLAQRVFEIERPAAPNAPGAVKALGEAADVFIEDLVKWTAQAARSARDTASAVSGKR